MRLPSLKVSTLLLTGLLIYDVFWVFFSSYIFSTNVMVKVATRPAENPVGNTILLLSESRMSRQSDDKVVTGGPSSAWDMMTFIWTSCSETLHNINLN